jgi:penicillin-binding protein-related factor A (putative recombinase)
MKKGGEFEDMIHRLLCQAGFRDITPIEPPVRIIRPLDKGKYVVVFTSHGVLDFAGPACGLHVEFDCKDIKGRRFPFSTIKKHQLERIKRLTEAGSLVGIVLRLRAAIANDDRLYGIPGFTLLNSIEAGDKSLSVDDLDEMVDAGDVAPLAYFQPGLLEGFFELCTEFKYVLPANYRDKGVQKLWLHRRLDLDEPLTGSSTPS